MPAAVKTSAAMSELLLVFILKTEGFKLPLAEIFTSSADKDWPSSFLLGIPLVPLVFLWLRPTAPSGLSHEQYKSNIIRVNSDWNISQVETHEKHIVCTDGSPQVY